MIIDCFGISHNARICGLIKVGLKTWNIGTTVECFYPHIRMQYVNCVFCYEPVENDGTERTWCKDLIWCSICGLELQQGKLRSSKQIHYCLPSGLKNQREALQIQPSVQFTVKKLLDNSRWPVFSCFPSAKFCDPHRKPSESYVMYQFSLETCYECNKCKNRKSLIILPVANFWLKSYNFIIL